MIGVRRSSSSGSQAIHAILKMKKSHLVVVWLGLMLCLSAFMLNTNVRRRKHVNEPSQSVSNLFAGQSYGKTQNSNSQSSHPTRSPPSATHRSISEPPLAASTTMHSGASLATNKSVADWLADPAVNEWKSEWRTKVTTGSKPAPALQHMERRTACSRPGSSHHLAAHAANRSIITPVAT
jgi:hypothetical protein